MADALLERDGYLAISDDFTSLIVVDDTKDYEPDCCCGVKACGCPQLMPLAFNGTLTGKTGFCVTFPASDTFTYDPVDHSWRQSAVWGTGLCYYAVKLLANPSSDPPYASCGWVFDTRFGPNRFASFPMASQNCDPLVFTLSVAALSDGGGACDTMYGTSGTFTLTLTPLP